MKLQDQLSKKRGDKEYRKYILNVSPQMIEKLGWKGGQEINAKVLCKNKLLLTGKKEKKK